MDDSFKMVLQQIRIRNADSMLIAVDGRCAAGKTTLAAKLQEELGCQVIHMDHFFLQPQQRTRQRMEEPGGNVDYERVLQEVMLPLSREEAAEYRRFDCQKMELSPVPFRVQPGTVTIVEGSYSCHPVLWGFYDLRIFLDIGAEEQLRRIRLRNGEEAVSQFQSHWIPLEERYFETYNIQERCDLAF